MGIDFNPFNECVLSGPDETYSNTLEAACIINSILAVAMLIVFLILIIKKGNVITALITMAYLLGFIAKAISMTDWLQDRSEA